MCSCMGCALHSTAKEANPVPQQDCIFSEAVPFYNSHKETLRANRPKWEAIRGVFWRGWEAGDLPSFRV